MIMDTPPSWWQCSLTGAAASEGTAAVLLKQWRQRATQAKELRKGQRMHSSGQLMLYQRKDMLQVCLHSLLPCVSCSNGTHPAPACSRTSDSCSGTRRAAGTLQPLSNSLSQCRCLEGSC